MAKDEKENVAKKFAKLVTEGPESYREKYKGMSEEEMAAKMTGEINAKMSAADRRREERYRASNARREERMREHMEKWDRHDWNKPIFLRRLAGKHSTFWRVFWGVFFLLAAGAVALQIFGVFSFVISIWWIILAILLFAIMIAAAANLNWFFVFVPAACLATIANYQIPEWHFANGQAIGGIFAVAILLTIAFSILFHRRSYCKSHQWIDDKKSVDDFSRSADSGDGSEVVVSARMGEAVRYIDSQNLEKVFVDCSLGSVKIYFNNAKIAGDKLVVNIRASLGGVEMYMPKNWRVVNSLNALAGGVEEKGRVELTPDSPTVTLRGSASLGGVEIVYI